MTRRYRRLIRLLHPDTAPPGRAAEAAAACSTLNTLRHEQPAPDPDTLTTPQYRYTLRLDTIAGATISGDLALLRRATAAPHRDPLADDLDVLLKTPRSPADNDLMEREATALVRLARHGDPRFHAYVPTLVESFTTTTTTTTGTTGTAGPDSVRRVNALRRLDGFHPLTALAEARPEGLDARDAAWIWRRLLVALGYAHRAGVRHGAVHPEHVLVHPEYHGVVLVDWCYSVTGPPAPLPALVERHRHNYPPEVLAREPATEATDLHLATRCMADLMGDQAPRELRAFIAGCTLPAEPRRPHDAWRLLAELDDLLDRRYGPRTFRPFHLPGTS